MNRMSDSKKSCQFFSWLQAIFYIVVSFATLYNLYAADRHNKLIFKPVIGVADVKTHRLITNESANGLDDVLGAKITFEIENKGSLPAKNVKISVRGKIGNTTLSFTENENLSKGIIMIQNTKYSNAPQIGKSILLRMKNNEKLFYKVSISFTDFEEYQAYQYDQFFEVRIITEKPLELGVYPISEVENF